MAAHPLDCALFHGQELLYEVILYLRDILEEVFEVVHPVLFGHLLLGSFPEFRFEHLVILVARLYLEKDFVKDP